MKHEAFTRRTFVFAETVRCLRLHLWPVLLAPRLSNMPTRHRAHIIQRKKVRCPFSHRTSLHRLLPHQGCSVHVDTATNDMIAECRRQFEPIQNTAKPRSDPCISIATRASLKVTGPASLLILDSRDRRLSLRSAPLYCCGLSGTHLDW